MKENIIGLFLCSLCWRSVGLMSNTALSAVQSLVRQTVGGENFDSFHPIIIGNMAFALFVPAVVFKKRFGSLLSI